jgi:hypothetical protein
LQLSFGLTACLYQEEEDVLLLLNIIEEVVIEDGCAI